MSKNKKERQSLSRMLKNNFYMLRFAAKYVPSYVFWMIVEGVIWGMIHSFTSVIFVKMLFDQIGAGSFEGSAFVIGLMAAFSLVTKFFHHWYWGIFNPKIRQTLHLRMQEVLFEKARSLDISCYDNPEFYNDFVWAINESDGRVGWIMEDVGKLINRTIATFTITGVLLTIDVSVVFAILAFVGLSAVINRWRQKVGFKRREEIVPEERKAGYVSRVYSLPEYAKEIRTSRAEEILIEDYEEAMAEQKKITKRYGKTLFVINSIQDTLSSGLLSGGIMALLVYRLFSGAILLGDFAAANNAIWKLYWQINSLIDFLMKFPEHSLYAEKFRKFMEYEPKVVGGNKPVPPVEEITFKNVSFRYDSSDRESLKNVDLTVKKGEKIAIVGYNGAGKSTLIKLLMHLYDPTDGEIRLNGVDLKELSIDEYRQKIAAAFQDYQIFAASVAENVVADVYTEDKRELVLSALHQATFDSKLEALENGIDTPLTREFSEKGVNLSGGEAQKIAIARAFARDSEIIVMDEPSSALDPIAEYELNQTILNYAQDKTIIFISHRLSTTRMADRIYMFSDGELIEQGTHDELIAKDGKYAEMFNLQAEKYQG